MKATASILRLSPEIPAKPGRRTDHSEIPAKPGRGTDAQAPTPRVAMSTSEVRGLWFDTARRYIVDNMGQDTLVALANRVDRGYREVLLEPDPTHWYPERVLQQSLAAMHAVIANGDDAAFTDVI